MIKQQLNWIKQAFNLNGLTKYIPYIGQRWLIVFTVTNIICSATVYIANACNNLKLMLCLMSGKSQMFNTCIHTSYHYYLDERYISNNIILKNYQSLSFNKTIIIMICIF